MSQKISIQIENKPQELRKVQREVEGFYSFHNLSGRVVHAINLAIDEVITNIIHYAYSDDDTHIINIQLLMSDNALTLTIEDDGIPFNPLDTTTPDTESSLEDRPIGGLGLHLVKNFMDEYHYTYLDKKNRLTLKKNIP